MRKGNRVVSQTIPVVSDVLGPVRVSRRRFVKPLPQHDSRFVTHHMLHTHPLQKLSVRYCARVRASLTVLLIDWLVD